MIDYWEIDLIKVDIGRVLFKGKAGLKPTVSLAFILKEGEITRVGICLSTYYPNVQEIYSCYIYKNFPNESGNFLKAFICKYIHIYIYK